MQNDAFLNLDRNDIVWVRGNCFLGFFYPKTFLLLIWTFETFLRIHFCQKNETSTYSINTSIVDFKNAI